MNLRRRAAGLVMLGLGVLVFAFQNCGRMNLDPTRAAELAQQWASSMFSERLDPACGSADEYDACIYQKSPVAQKEMPLDANEELASLRIFGVRLRGLNSSGFLENDSFSVVPAEGERVMATDGKWKFAPGDGTKLAQVAAYYWLQRTFDDVGGRVGIFYAGHRGLRAFVGGTKTGWSSKDATIYLGERTGVQSAYDASIIVRLLAEANISFATEGRIYKLEADTNHLDCGPSDGYVYEKDCCASKNGCVKAIVSGASDYLVALMFPDAPAFAETWLNRPDGMAFCGINRDLRENLSLAAEDAFMACDSTANVRGQVHVMGTLYASMWWALRAQAAGNPEKQKRLDQLYMRHLSRIESGDTFLSMLEKIKALDLADFGGEFSADFEQMYRERGLLNVQ